LTRFVEHDEARMVGRTLMRNVQKPELVCPLQPDTVAR
jgi:hypothetical protein